MHRAKIVNYFIYFRVSAMALRILILTPRIPYPLRDGGAIAMNQTIESYLEQGCEVSLLSLNTSRHWIDESLLPQMYGKLNQVKTVYVKTDVNPLSAFFNLFTDKSYNVARFINKEVETALIDLLRSDTFDIIQFESIYTSPYLKTARKYSDAKCICRVHNIEYLIWQRLSENESSFLKRKYLNLLTNRLRAYELDILRKFDLLLPISVLEKDYLEEHQINQCYYLPFGVSPKTEIPIVPCEKLSCFHIGSMDWAPNVEGVNWFLDQIWSELQSEFKDVTIYLAGKNMPATFYSKEGPHLKVIGEVEDVMQFSLEKNIMLVPLRSGAGIRIKMIEAMAIGKTIISTDIGASGIGAVNGQEILIANTVAEFRSALQFCFQHPDEAKAIGERARAFVFANYEKSLMYTRFIDYLQLLVSKHGA
jgi:glycosyltransferase involved in cell wall biosynthesis